MSLFDRHFHGSYRAVRAYLLEKTFLALVALDTFTLMIGHAGRYGADGFNVAHFAWLDRSMPLPNAATYIAVLLLAGLLALGIALLGSHPLVTLALFLLYTYSWSMSMLDSYQHHYFLSLTLLCLVFFPRVTTDDVDPLPPAAVDGERSKKQRKRDHERALRARGEWIYVGVILVSALAWATLGTQRPWLAFTGLLGVIAASTWLVSGRSRERVAMSSGFGYPLLASSIAVLYLFTSIAKMDAQWLSGHTIRRISSAENVFAPLVTYLGQLGVPPERFWPLLASSVIPLELAVAAAYLIAVHQDQSPSRLVRLSSIGGFALAMMLHLGAEAMSLEIGWFSYYMMLLACVYLLPGGLVEKLALLLVRPAALIRELLSDFVRPRDPARATWPTLAMALLLALVLALVGRLLDLPGSSAAGLTAGLVLLGLTALLVGRQKLARARELVFGAGVAAALMWMAITQSEVRWDFYRYLGGDLARRNQPEAALDAYRKGERYAPSGQSRKDKIRELEQKLGR